MNTTIRIEGNESVIGKVIALLKVIPEIKIQTQKETLKKEFIPNAKTKKAIEDAMTEKGCKSYKNSAEMFKSLDINV